MPIAYERFESTAKVTIDRPEALNALNIPAMRDLRSCLIEARDDPAVRVIVLTGAGERAFCVGADLKQTFPSERSVASSFWLSDEDSIDAGMYIRALDIDRLQLNKPIIAAINGHCVGGGLELALQCDIRIGVERATFGLTEARVGSIPAIGGAQRLLRTVPQSVAMTMLLSGERIDGLEAYRWGLISRLTSPEELQAEAVNLALRIAESGPLAVQAIKQMTVEGWNMPLRAALLMEQMMWGMLRDTNDRIEGRNAFSEKRPPRFDGT